MYATELKPGATVLIDPPPDVHIRLSNAVLFKRPKRKDARVVLQIGDPDSSDVQVAFAVLTAATDNVPLDLVINSPMFLRIDGSNLGGAVVHVTGSEEDPVDFGDDEARLQFPTELVNMNELFADGDARQVQLGGLNGAKGGSSDDDDDDDSSSDSSSDDDDDDDSDEIQKAPVAQNGQPARAADAGANSSAQTGKRRNRPDGGGGAGDGPAAKKGKASGKGEDADGKDEAKAQGKAVVKRGKGTLPLIDHRSGLQYRDVVLGVGKRVQRGRYVALQYTLRLENGKVIDKADRKRPFKFRVGIGECVKGFDIGVMGMREGGERHLIVPPDLGYGQQTLPGIPARSTLYFDISVVKAF